MRQELSDSITDYQRFRSSQDYSKATLRAEQMILKRFLTVNGNIWVHAITERHVNVHFEAASKTRGAASLQQDHSVLISFLEWARKTGRMPSESDPMYGRRSAKPVRRERNRIPAEDFPRLLDVAEARDKRDRALAALFLYTLMRGGEVTDLRIRDLDLRGGWLSARIHKTRLEDRMPICSELDSELRAWLTYYAEHVGDLKPHYYLVPTRKKLAHRADNGRITGHGVAYRPETRIKDPSRLIKVTLEDFGWEVADVDGKSLSEGAHTLRRSGARALFDSLVTSGYDYALRVVQSMLHHSSMQTTEGYLGITADRRSRDELIRGHRMYAQASGNVVSIAR